MERYLKSLSMRAKDGNVLVPPVCCINCKELQCSTSCDKYQKAMGGVKCVQVEMEFGRVDTWWELLWRIVPYAILTGITVVLMMWICHRDVQRSVVSVGQLSYESATCVNATITFEGPKVDQDRFLQALTKALQSLGKKE